MTSVCIESTLDVYRNDFTCVSKRLGFVSKRLVSHRNDFVSKRPYNLSAIFKCSKSCLLEKNYI